MGTIVKTIGLAGTRDFQSIQAFIDSLPADLVADGNAYVGECYNDGELLGRVAIPAKTTSQTCNITLRCAPGHSFREHPNRLNNPLRYEPAQGVAIANGAAGAASGQITFTNFANYTVVDGLQIKNATGSDAVALDFRGANSVIKNCVVRGAPRHNGNAWVVILSGALMHNCLVVNAVSNGSSGVRLSSSGRMYNCTVVRPGDLGQAVYGISSDATSGNNYTNLVRNCAVFGFVQARQNFFSANCSNNATDLAESMGTESLQSVVYADQFVQNSNAAGLDLRIKPTSALLNAGADFSSAGIPAESIVGAPRSTWDIGAWEIEDAVTRLLLNPPALMFGAVNRPSSNFIVAGNGYFPAPVTVTPSDNGDGGTFNPATVTLSAETPSAAFTYTPATTGDKVITLSNDVDPALINPDAVTYQSADETTALEWVSYPNLFRSGVLSGNFVIKANGVLSTPLVVTPTDNGAGGTFTPTNLTLSANTLTGQFKYTPGPNSGLTPIRLTNDRELGNPANLSMYVRKAIVITPTASTPDTTVVTVGTGKDYANLREFGLWLAGQDLRTLQKSIIAEVYESHTVWGGALSIFPSTSSTQYKVTIRPVPGLGIADLDPGNELNYDVEGIELVFSGSMRIGRGVTVTGFRIDHAPSVTGTIALSSNNSWGADEFPKFIRNRIRLRAAGVAMFGSGEYLTGSTFTDNVIIADGAAVPYFLGAGTGVPNVLERNTFIAVNGGSFTGSVIAFGSQATADQLRLQNNAFINCGANLFGSYQPVASSKIVNNMTNVAMATPLAGITADTTNQFLRNNATDWRPFVGGPLEHSGDTAAVNMADVRNVKRGGNPDLGGVQGSLVQDLPAITITEIIVDGQDVTIRGTTMFEPTSGMLSLVPDAADPDGASAPSAVPITFTPDAFEAKVLKVTPGNYRIPLISATNTVGFNTSVEGGETISVLGVDATIVEGKEADPVGGAPVVNLRVLKFDGKTLAVRGTVDPQGDKNCAMQVFLDQDGGSTIGPLAVNRMGRAWGVVVSTAPSKFTVRVVATANGQTATATSALKKVIKVTSRGVLPDAPLTPAAAPNAPAA